MPFEMTLDQFLTRAGYTNDDWQKSELDWSNLLEIAKHHDSALHTLGLHGGTIANRIQAFNSVHSVRWRIKDTFGLLKKILRKNLDSPKKEKRIGVTPQNYRSVVSDLIGVRALHLLKEDCITIDESIRKTWDVTDVSIFKRQGDGELSEIIERGASEEIHDAGYRSIHYALTYRPEKDIVPVELQVRTIFQEGWSEIDHKVKYPDFSNNELLTYFLSVFNGLAGTADDMGSFVLKLDGLIKTTNAETLKNEAIVAERDSNIEAMQQEINKLKSEGKTPASSINSLQRNIDNIKEKTSPSGSSILDYLGSYLANYYKLNQLQPSKEYIDALKIANGTSEQLQKAAQALNGYPNIAKMLQTLDTAKKDPKS